MLYTQNKNYITVIGFQEAEEIFFAVLLFYFVDLYWDIYMPALEQGGSEFSSCKVELRN